MRWQILIAGLALAACKDDTGAVMSDADAALLDALAGRTAAAGRPEVPAVPSGMRVGLQEIVLDVKPDGEFTYARFRFVAPAVRHSQAPDMERRALDMQFLCSNYALPLLVRDATGYDRIVVSVSDRETEFGVANPDAAQFFESYRVENGACMWEEF